MQCPTLFRQTRILDAVAQTDYLTDVLLATDGKFHVGGGQAQIPEGTEISDLTGLVLGTGLVDLYSTSGEPGFEQRETLASLAEAARRGGFAKVGILPHTQPAIDDIAALEFWRSQKHLPFMPWGAITKGCEGKQIADLAELAEFVVGFTDAKPMANLALVRRAMEYIKPLGKPMMLMPQDLSLVASGVMREGKWSLQYGLSGIPDIAETSALAALLELVRLTHTPTHFMRISSARSVELIAQAKADGLPVTASVPWLNLWLEDRDLHSYDPNLRLIPALGNEADRRALIAGVKSGAIDAIAVDHTPYTYEEKTVAFEVAPAGAIGLELALPMLWQQLVETGLLTGLELWQAMSSRPARCLNLNSDQLSLQTLFDPNQSWTVTASAIASLSHNTPCLGKVAIGKVI
ncbi:dihydroorotase [Tumidithrix helvetica PCC 7403]